MGIRCDLSKCWWCNMEFSNGEYEKLLVWSSRVSKLHSTDYFYCIRKKWRSIEKGRKSHIICQSRKQRNNGRLWFCLFQTFCWYWHMVSICVIRIWCKKQYIYRSLWGHRRYLPMWMVFVGYRCTKQFKHESRCIQKISWFDYRLSVLCECDRWNNICNPNL